MITRRIQNTPIPALGLGTFRLTGSDGTDAIQAGLEMGYTHLDTAIMYDNEREVGQAIARAGIPRETLFVTTKIWYTDLDPETVAKRVPE
ncbi:aldo/keto reductase, partial [Acinetobacter baumannii]|uniref:aldo/keto reductase n=1 Tax=Acinetobacter baumannii TaxID=470 RepID=UPI001178A410